ncbi:MAG TPA: hypothetical protein VFT71_06450, partial [Candidatus Nitrosocosmicus sp.]|nr:hypothetical protein [Candidatus Nitrosocosmicus sp.]
NMTCDNCIPADIQISVGKDHIIEMVNEYIGIFDKQGNLLRNETIIQFFRILNGSIENPITSDPYIVYDHIQNKWFVSLMILDVKAPTPSNRVILLSESANDNPLGVWNSKIVRLDTDTFAKCIDRPALSITQKYLVVSANMGPQNRTGYCSGEAPVGSKLIVLNKNDLMLEDDLSFFNLTQYGQLSLLPINSKGIGNSICFIGNTMAAGENVWLYSVKNINDTFVLSKAKLGPFLNPMYNPTGGIQPNLDTGDEKILHTGDSRILDTSYHEGKIWNVFNTSCKVTQDNQARTCIGLFQINTGNSSSQLNCSPENSRISFDPAPIGGNGFSLYYPSIEFDTNGNAFVIYGYSSKESFPSLGLLALTENNNNILLSKKELVKGDHPANDTKNYRCEYSQIFYDCNRHGDYFGSSSDPADPSAIWLAGVYYNDDHYSTYIIKVSNLG